MSSRQLNVVLDLDSSSYSGKIGAAGSQMKTFGGQVKSAATEVDTFGKKLDQSGHFASSSLQHLRDYVLTISGLESIVSSLGHTFISTMESAIQMSAELERQTMLMKGMSEATTEAGKIADAQHDMAALFEMSKNTGYSIQDLANSFVRLKSTGIDPMKGTLQETTDAVAAFGGNSNTMQHVALALQEMADKGTLSMKELRRQFAIFVPDGMRTMANVLGMTMDEMTKKISAGAIQARPAMELMLRQLGIAHAGAAEMMAKTLTGQLNAFHTNMIQMSQAFTGEASNDANSLYATVKRIMSQINAALSSNEGRAAFFELGNDVAAVVRNVAALAKILVEYRGTIEAIAEAVATVIAAKLLRTWSMDVISGISNIKTSIQQMLSAEAGVRDATMSRLQYNAALLAGVRANQDVLDITAERISLEAEGAMQEEEAARTQAAIASQAVANAQRQVDAIQLQLEARLRLVQEMEAEQAVALEQLQTGRTVTGQFVARAEALAVYQNATSRLTTAEGMLARTDTELAAATSRLTAATEEAAQAQGILVTASTNASAAFDRQLVAEEAATAGVTLYEGVAAAATIATEALSTAISFLLGPVGIFAMIILEAANNAGVFTSEADKATAAADRMRQGFEKAGDAAQVAARKASISQQIQEINASRNSDGTITQISPDGNAVTTLSKADVDKQIADLNNNLDNLGEAQKSAFQHHYDHTVQDLVDVTNKNIEKFKQQVIGADQAQWQAIREAQAKNPGDKLAAKNAQRLSFAEDQRVAQYSNEQLKGLQKTASQYHTNTYGAEAYRDALGQLIPSINQESDASLYSAATNGEAAKGHDKAAKAIDGKKVALAGLEAKLNGTGVAIAKFNQQLKDGDFSKWSPQQIATARGIAEATDAVTAAMKRQADEKGFDKKIESAAGKLAELKSKLADGGLTKELDKFNAELNAGMFKGVDQSKIEAMRKILGDIDDTNHDIAVKGFGDKLSQDLTKANTQSKELWASYAAGTLDADKKGDDLEGTLEAQLATLNLQGKTYDDMLATIHQIVQVTKEAEAASEANRISKEADKINAGLVGGGKLATARAELDQEIQLEYKRVVVSKEGTDARKRELDAFYKWRASKEAQFNRDNESAVVKQARQWSDLASNLQEAYASILSSFVDGLASGQMNFKQFAVEILKEIAKVILEALIAYAILSAIGMTPTNASGGKMNFGQFVSQGVANSFNMTPAGKHHTGGIIGSSTDVSMYPASLWEDAKRFHNGGIIGLQPNEVPIIGLKGERVLTEDEQKRMASSGQAPPVTVNVINNGSDEMKPDVSTHWNGKEMIVNVVLEAASKQGPMRDMLTSLASKK